MGDKRRAREMGMVERGIVHECMNIDSKRSGSRVSGVGGERVGGRGHKIRVRNKIRPADPRKGGVKPGMNDKDGTRCTRVASRKKRVPNERPLSFHLTHYIRKFRAHNQE